MSSLWSNLPHPPPEYNALLKTFSKWLLNLISGVAFLPFLDLVQISYFLDWTVVSSKPLLTSQTILSYLRTRLLVKKIEKFEEERKKNWRELKITELFIRKFYGVLITALWCPSTHFENDCINHLMSILCQCADIRSKGTMSESNHRKCVSCDTLASFTLVPLMRFQSLDRGSLVYLSVLCFIALKNQKQSI